MPGRRWSFIVGFFDDSQVRMVYLAGRLKSPVKKFRLGDLGEIIAVGGTRSQMVFNGCAVGLFELHLA